MQYVNKDGDRWVNLKQLITVIRAEVPKGKAIDPAKLADWLEEALQEVSLGE